MNHEEGSEGHDEHEGGLRPLRVSSPLLAETERVMTETIGCAIAVHRELGQGFLESIYRAAMAIESTRRGLAFGQERAIVVNYRGIKIPGQRVDFIVEARVILELKAVTQFDESHQLN